MSWRHRDAKREAREVRRLYLRCEYNEMTVGPHFVHRGHGASSIVESPNGTGVVVSIDTARYLIATGAQRRGE